MTKVALARVIGANKVRRRPFKTRARTQLAPAARQAPAPRSQPARRRRSQTGPRSQAPTQQGKIAGP